MNLTLNRRIRKNGKNSAVPSFIFVSHPIFHQKPAPLQEKKPKKKNGLYPREIIGILTPSLAEQIRKSKHFTFFSLSEGQKATLPRMRNKNKNWNGLRAVNSV